ncbi:bifunctional tetrahydrofolate synthase/dihydrofolate synthase [Candidatus Steffania adelgidicola]|uniref:bifunctional tetrahydrofolate synthase/dihydrofolate synthase n=1 Tax=Candidatus Steffania adelgidicola TaxID=1076626 RepID=UPI001D028AF8|nr:bifunctional tetrahydrofolate synthase/dihydrofolate synthase [Candidatus Steffania adelgidicola]UDG79669.1 Dihydrofolate synthase/folylpolyglutamate synthase [Candidatus Steffania adelgidicola]
MENLTVPNAMSPLAIWLCYLEQLHMQSIDLGLERVRHVASILNLLHPAPYVITVGGTNGKGTTCRLLEVILLASGIRVGVYSSPHLLCYTERVRIQGIELPEISHGKALAVIENGRGTTSLSYFEFATLAALYLFREGSLDVVILEVGLGGRLDATNVVDADIAVITCIALDHTNFLGSDRSSIAWEKAGIFRRGRLAVIGEPDRPGILDAAAVDRGSILYALNRDWWWKDDGRHWCWWDSRYELTELMKPAIPLENAATALATISCLPFTVPEGAIRQGLREAMLPGRFQCIGHNPMIILDVAHNPHAAAYLSWRLTGLPRRGRLLALVGMLADKNIADTLACLCRQVDVWYCVSLSVPRAASAATLASHLDGQVQQFDNVCNAWMHLIADAAPKDYLLVFGSFYTVAMVIRLIGKEKYYGE